jgi:hypothetical protein
MCLARLAISQKLPVALECADDRIRDCPDPGDASEVAMDYHPNRVSATLKK